MSEPQNLATIPVDFGAPNGTEISNKATLLTEIDRALGVHKPPDLEYLFVLPYTRWRLQHTWLGFAGNYYGHAAVKYTHPETGEQIVMNITGHESVRREQLVYFDYYY